MSDEYEREDDDLLRRTEAGDEQALTELFTRHWERLWRMVWLRLDRRLRWRIDAADVLQETYLEVAQRARDYLAQPTLSPFLWLRFLTGQKLLVLHRPSRIEAISAVGAIRQPAALWRRAHRRGRNHGDRASVHGF
jgi:DNA-directed RNA polymerase specialized sigma24 family protein